MVPPEDDGGPAGRSDDGVPTDEAGGTGDESARGSDGDPPEETADASDEPYTTEPHESAGPASAADDTRRDADTPAAAHDRSREADDEPADDDRTAGDRAGGAAPSPRGHTAGTPFVAGAVGGLVGAVGFGALMWFVNPTFLRSSIPALYGLEPRGLFGWSVHLFHGIVLGIVFGAVVSRAVVHDALVPADPDQLGPGGLGIRLVGGGVAYGIAVWALVPVLALPILSDPAGADAWGTLSIAGSESLVGHVVFGLLLGVVYAAIVRRW